MILVPVEAGRNLKSAAGRTCSFQLVMFLHVASIR